MKPTGGEGAAGGGERIAGEIRDPRGSRFAATVIRQVRRWMGFSMRDLYESGNASSKQRRHP